MLRNDVRIATSQKLQTTLMNNWIVTYRVMMSGNKCKPELARLNRASGTLECRELGALRSRPSVERSI